MPVNYDLNIIKGSTFAARVIASNADGSPVDLTSYETRGYVKQRYSDSGVLLDLGPVPTPGYETSGYIDILIHASGTEVLPVTQGVYDIEMYGPTGTDDFVIKLLDGRVNIHPEVTNPKSSIIQYYASAGQQQSAPGTGTTTTTTTTTTVAPTTTTTTVAPTPATSITIVDPMTSSYVSFDFDLAVSGSNFDHWHWTDDQTNPNGFDSYSVGQSVLGMASSVMVGNPWLTTTISASSLPANWGPGTLYVIAVDSNHIVLADANGDPAKDMVVITVI